jgi:hypothetical protein
MRYCAISLGGHSVMCMSDWERGKESVSVCVGENITGIGIFMDICI